MKKFLLPIAFIFTVALPTFAQTASTSSAYRIDNFDFVSGVRIELPPPPPTAKKLRKGRALTSSPALENSASSASLVSLPNANAGTALSGFTTGDPTVDSYIVESGRRNSVDPLLLYSIMHQESTFKPRAMSNKGARGLMQLMPGTASRFGVSNIWDPKQNIEGGSRYMRFLLDTFDGDVKLALAGYNAGEGAVMKYGYRVPPYSETQEYVRRISKRYDLIRDPFAARYASNYSRQQVAANKAKEPTPLSLYERSVFAVKLPDGRLQLVTQ
ncbi:MAG TPA: lytic transglycosylase domain-containing protein [Pyrinomonadaceae bacterium]|nr:lytic transglycosylase domain-containing protein [Pyrinomonadaceae bacterium]